MKIIKLIIFYLLVFMGCVTTPYKPSNNDIAGIYYCVKQGDTIQKIAQKHSIPSEEIKEVNGIEHDKKLKTGQLLFLPDKDPIGKKIASLSTPQKPKTTIKHTERIFDFPVPSGTIIYNFSSAKQKPYDGVGIKAPLGTPIRAPENGRVLFVGNDGSRFGLIMIIEHQEPYITVYTHLHKALFKTDQLVKRRDIIATVGTSGGISIPHLHFQVRVHHKPKDPRLFLRSIP